MTDVDLSEKALASYVALRVDDWAPEQGCAAWLESAERTCTKPVVEGAMLCKRHRNISLKREQAARVKQKEQKVRRDAYRAENLPKWRAERELIEAQMERYGSPATTDRAAYGGATHPSIRRKQLQQFSDTNVRRMADLSKRWQRLTEQIGDDQ